MYNVFLKLCLIFTIFFCSKTTFGQNSKIDYQLSLSIVKNLLFTLDTAFQIEKKYTPLHAVRIVDTSRFLVNPSTSLPLKPKLSCYMLTYVPFNWNAEGTYIDIGVLNVMMEENIIKLSTVCFVKTDCIRVPVFIKKKYEWHNITRVLVVKEESIEVLDNYRF